MTHTSSSECEQSLARASTECSNFFFLSKCNECGFDKFRSRLVLILMVDVKIGRNEILSLLFTK